mmetsp:Transcript_20414/g.33808  ORF Transcript_20414/g.33808 Transcript_20414/m.33808 type:complete len:280 (+) Transcript_20414:81-920(+)
MTDYYLSLGNLRSFVIIVVLLFLFHLCLTAKAITGLILITLIFSSKIAQSSITSGSTSLVKGWQQDLINQAVLNRLIGKEIKVTLHILTHLGNRLSRHFRQFQIQTFVRLDNRLDLESNIRSLSLKHILHSSMLQQESCIGHGPAKSLRSSTDQHRTNTGAESQINGSDFASLIPCLHNQIVYGESWSEEGSRHVEINIDRFGHTFLAEVEEHANDFIASFLVNEATDREGSITEHTSMNVDKLSVIRAWGFVWNHRSLRRHLNRISSSGSHNIGLPLK